ANAVASRLKTVQARGFGAKLIHGQAPYDMVFANILARPLVGLAPGIAKVTARGGTIVLSGLLTHQESMVRRAYTGRGLVLIDRLHRDGWSTLVYGRPALC
ncbi:MAG: 50S ribosomal protein L11 methyltransferase, partial [Pseudomonadota bacterium]